jgi:hypothetical protein
MSTYNGSQVPESASERASGPEQMNQETVTNKWGERMGKVRPIRKPDRPIRKCPKCGLRTSLQTCPSISCKNARTISDPNEGRI